MCCMTDPTELNAALDAAREAERGDRDAEIDDEIERGTRVDEALRARTDTRDTGRHRDQDDRT
jgi:hypothetical protein